MRKFDTKTQLIKYKVLREVAKEAWDDKLLQRMLDIPKRIVPGKVPTMRCCVYKERAILGERVKLAMGGDRTNPNVIELIDVACDECPTAGYEVTSACRGCLAHRCEDVCKRGAITFDRNHVAYIDKSKCIECGACAKVCPFTAIVHRKRPCQNACKINAITIDEEEKLAHIDNSKCISCGACVYQCPFGAISDKSYILDVIDIIKRSENNSKYKVIALIAPSIANQFSWAKLGQVVSGLKKLGFYDVVEVALGADMVAQKESKELVEKGFLTSSCCPAFVEYINKSFPKLKDYISHNLSPMAELGKFIKENDKNTKIIFIGPCISKKMEYKKEHIRPYVDSVITFEELQALFDSKDIEITELNEQEIDNASYFGRIFAKSGGLTCAVKQALKENNVEFDLKPLICNGIEECKKALLRKNVNALEENFIEGMACVGGCVEGAGCLSHGNSTKALDSYCLNATNKTIEEAVLKTKNKV